MAMGLSVLKQITTVLLLFLPTAITSAHVSCSLPTSHGDGKVDLAVANANTNNSAGVTGGNGLSIFLNTTVPAVTNNPPTANDDTVTVAEDSGASTINVLVNDSTAPDVGETLTITSVTQPTAGTGSVTFAASSVTFTPAANFFGTTSFTYTISDGRGGTATGTVSITVTPVADTPSVTTASTSEDTQTASGLVISRNAADGAEVTHFKITAITNGTLFQNNGTTAINSGDFITFAQGNAGLKFTPSADFNGAASFQVQAFDFQRQRRDWAAELPRRTSQSAPSTMHRRFLVSRAPASLTTRATARGK